MKTKVIKIREDMPPLCKAYMKELRANNKTRREYDINPYAEVYKFRDNLYGILTESLDGMGAPWIFLIIGPEKALLIDTSFGLGDLKGLVNLLTGGKPLIVVNTHSHYDHAYGNCQFDRVFCHHNTVPFLESKRNPHIWDYLFDENGKGIWAEFDKKDIVPFREYEIIGCENGHIFNIGEDYEIELVFMGGHEAGHTGYLDKKNRIFFAGDDITAGRVGIGGPRPGTWFGEFSTVTAMRNELVKINKRISEFDVVFPSHFIVELENTVMQHMIDTCNEVIADPDAYSFIGEVNGGKRKFKLIKNLGTLAYSDTSI